MATETVGRLDGMPGGSPQTQSALTRNVRTIGMVWTRELIRLKRTPTRIISGLAQPFTHRPTPATGPMPSIISACRPSNHRDKAVSWDSSIRQTLYFS